MVLPSVPEPWVEHLSTVLSSSLLFLDRRWQLRMLHFLGLLPCPTSAQANGGQGRWNPGTRWGSSAFASVCSALWQWLHLVGRSSSLSLTFAHPALTIANRGVPCQFLYASSAFLQHPGPCQHGSFSLSEFFTWFGPLWLPRQIALLTRWSPKGSNDCTLVTKTSFPWA